MISASAIKLDYAQQEGHLEDGLGLGPAFELDHDVKDIRCAAI